LKSFIVESKRVGFIVLGALAFAAAGVMHPMASSEAANPQALVSLSGTCNTRATPFCNALMTPLPTWTGHVFKLSQDYPATPSPPGPQPWLNVDPKTHPGEYVRTVLRYFYEGNIHPSMENSFDPRLNPIRRWYNAPFQDLGLFGREFVHGLTEERNSSPYELTELQKSVWTNYAVGYYNAPGGEVIRNIWNPWRKTGSPDIATAKFVPEGTVAAKLLFTTASLAEVPFAAGAPAWDAYIYQNLHAYPTPGAPRVVGKVRLLQIDVAVKDSRAGKTGWFFGTFVYGGGPNYKGPTLGTSWHNVAPVGLMWGNDPGYTPPPSPKPMGAGLTETWLNPSVHMLHYGYQNRLNGPVDNPISSCMSCHSTGQWKNVSSMVPPIPTPTPPATPPPHPVAFWFRNIGPSQPFDVGQQSTGYSLQVMDGIINYYLYIAPTENENASQRKMRYMQLEQKERRPLRDGGGT
jgi:hypothetical protein